MRRFYGNDVRQIDVQLLFTVPLLLAGLKLIKFTAATTAS